MTTNSSSKKPDFLADFCRTEPFCLNNAPQGAQEYFPIHHRAKQALPSVGDNGDEICAGLGVVAGGKAYGVPVVDDRVEFHKKT